MCEYCDAGTQFLVWNPVKTTRTFARKTCLAHLSKTINDVIECYSSEIVTVERVEKILRLEIKVTTCLKCQKDALLIIIHEIGTEKQHIHCNECGYDDVKVSIPKEA